MKVFKIESAIECLWKLYKITKTSVITHFGMLNYSSRIIPIIVYTCHYRYYHTMIKRNENNGNFAEMTTKNASQLRKTAKLSSESPFKLLLQKTASGLIHVVKVFTCFINVPISERSNHRGKCSRSISTMTNFLFRSKFDVGLFTTLQSLDFFNRNY